MANGCCHFFLHAWLLFMSSLGREKERVSVWCVHGVYWAGPSRGGGVRGAARIWSSSCKRRQLWSSGECQSNKRRKLPCLGWSHWGQHQAHWNPWPGNSCSSASLKFLPSDNSIFAVIHTGNSSWNEHDLVELFPWFSLFRSTPAHMKMDGWSRFDPVTHPKKNLWWDPRSTPSFVRKKMHTRAWISP